MRLREIDIKDIHRFTVPTALSDCEELLGSSPRVFVSTDVVDDQQLTLTRLASESLARLLGLWLASRP